MAAIWSPLLYSGLNEPGYASSILGGRISQEGMEGDVNLFRSGQTEFFSRKICTSGNCTGRIMQDVVEDRIVLFL